MRVRGKYIDREETQAGRHRQIGGDKKKNRVRREIDRERKRERERERERERYRYIYIFIYLYTEAPHC